MNLLLDESDHFLNKDKIKDLKDFSVDVISCSFDGVEVITNSNENEVLKAKEFLQSICIAKDISDIQL